MENKYNKVFDEMVFQIATLMFPNSPILTCHIELVKGWARYKHIDELLWFLKDDYKNPNIKKEGKQW